MNQSNLKVVEELLVKLAEKKTEVVGKEEEFKTFKHSISLNAAHSRTGKPFLPKDIEQLEALEERKELEVTTVRLENLRLKSRLKRQEQLLRQKVWMVFMDRKNWLMDFI